MKFSSIRPAPLPSPLQTCEAWLAKMDANKDATLAVLEGVYGKQQRLRRYVNWRLFFISCAELFGYADGEAWAVSHYRFVNKRTA